jgi:hypothetical protein
VATQGVNVKITGLKATKKALKALPEEFTTAVGDASWEISQEVAVALRAKARSVSKQAGLLAPTVATGEALMPVVMIGGSSKVGRHANAAYKILFGSEFGSHAYKQFQPTNPAGYWIYPTVTAMQEGFVKKWSDAADKAIAQFEHASESDL